MSPSASSPTAVKALVRDIDPPDQESWLVARLASLVGLPASDATQEELFTAWRRFLEAIAATAPLVIVVEDLHWADPALLSFLAHLYERTVGLPIVILTTARPEFYDKAPTWAVGQRNAKTITLVPLDRTETHSWSPPCSAPVSCPQTSRLRCCPRLRAIRCTPPSTSPS